MKRLNKKNIKKGKVPNKSGLYYLYNSGGKRIYVGHSRKLRHRLQSYYQKDCFRTHPAERRKRDSRRLFKSRNW